MDIQPQNKNLNRPTLTSRGFGGSNAASANLTNGRVIKIIFAVSLVAGCLAVIVYGGIFLWQRSLKIKSADLTKEIQQIESQPIIDKALAQDIKATSEAISVLKNLLASHIVSESLFKLVEGQTLTNVSWDSLTFKAPQLVTGSAGGGLATLALSGSTQTYLMAGRQLRAFESLPEVKSVKLSQFSESDSGVIFGLNIDLSPDNFFFKVDY